MMIQHFFCSALLLTSSIMMHGNMLRDMSIMMGAQLGASIADTTVSDMYKQVAKGIENDQTNMNNAETSFLQNMQQAQQTQVKNIGAVFSSATQEVSSMMTQKIAATKEMQSYLERITSLQLPVNQYLSDPVHWDQVFANSTMYAPQGPVWRNIFQIGNWQYDETTNSFWQMQHQPFLTQATASSGSAQAVNDAYQNSIFTEWQTREPYVIECDITLYKVSYPFYVGIIFNKTRWISGDTYGIQKYRTLGFYGNPKGQISLCYAEQTVPPLPTTAVSSIPQPQYPLSTIYSGMGAQKIILNQESFKTVQVAPLTMHFKIKPGPSLVEYKMWPNDGTAEPASYIAIKTESKASQKIKKSDTQAITITTKTGASYTFNMVNNSDIYLYHGIGFLSPGAIAQFKLKQPTPLVFSQTAIQKFTKDFNEYLKDNQASLATNAIDAALLSQRNIATPS